MNKIGSFKTLTA